MQPHRNNRGLPPQHPYYRRGSSNAPISSLALCNSPQPIIASTNRSRSLDGLLDAEEAKAAVKECNTNPSKSCDDLDANQLQTETNNNEEESKKTNLQTVKSFSADDRLDCVMDGLSDVCDKTSICSNSSESKRKRNFMDRCVNKVRSLIKK